jgi:FlgD Ig-like domain
VRIAQAVVVLGLLAATAVAFVTTQRQKLERSPVGRLVITKVFSPVCDCSEDKASIQITLRRADTVTLEIVNADDERVRTLVRKQHYPRGPIALEWDGRDGSGRIVPDGAYRPRLTLASGARTFVLRNPIRVDTRSPEVTRAVIAPTTVSPDGDGRNDLVAVRYTVDERAHGLLFVDGKLNTRTRFQRLQGVMRWNGKRRGRGLPAGSYELSVGGEDTAGNVGPPTAAVAVRVRYIELGRPVVRVRMRARFGVNVLTDARRFRWRFAGGSGTARPGLLVLRAPRRPGRYTLFVAYDGHGASAPVIVTRRPPARVARS